MKIAIHLPGGLGDELCLTPTYRALKEKYPGCEITAHVSHPEMLLMNPYVDHLSNCNRNWSAVEELKRYDQYIYMFWQANKRQVFSNMHLVDWFASQAKVELTNRSLIFNLGDSDRQFLDGFNFDNRMIVTFDAYGNKVPNKWDSKNFTSTIKYLREKYNAITVQIGLQDYGIKADLNLVKRLTIRQVAAMIERSDLYIGNDSGAAHIASAVKTDAIKIFGCTDPKCYMHNDNEIAVTLDIPCQGCQNKNPTRNPIHKKSILCPAEQFACIKIPVEKVFTAIDEMVRKKHDALDSNYKNCL